jgi:hypothetical protein
MPNLVSLCMPFQLGPQDHIIFSRGVACKVATYAYYCQNKWSPLFVQHNDRFTYSPPPQKNKSRHETQRLFIQKHCMEFNLLCSL